MDKDLTYRVHQERDLPCLLRMWKEESGWGALTAHDWEEWYVHAPGGPATVIVAADPETDDPVGQLTFQPTLISVDGREIRAVRPSAPIMSRDMRPTMKNLISHDHPVGRMYLYGAKLLKERGYDLVYTMPDPRWQRVFQSAPFLRFRSFPLWRLPLPLALPLELGEGYLARPLAVWDERVDRLWSAAARLHDCLVVRDRRFLPWRTGDHEVLEVERAGEMVGLVAARQKGHRQWLICDVLTIDMNSALRSTLAAAVNLANERAASLGEPLQKVGVLVTPSLQPAVESLGFVRDSYDFLLAVHVLNPSLADAIAPHRWYVSAND